MSKLKQLSFASINDIDYGSIALAVDKALTACLNDCADRPEVKKGRKVTLEIELVPVIRDGQFYGTTAKFAVDGRHPKRGVELMMMSKNGGLHFNPEVGENPAQKTLELEEESED